jgi:hypothetical protein
MELWQIFQYVYPLLSVLSIVISTAAFATVLTWPGMHIRSLFVAAFGTAVVASLGYLLLQVTQLLPVIGLQTPMSGGALQIGYLMLAIINLVGNGLLLAGVIGLGRLFTKMRYRSAAGTSPFEQSGQ